MPGNVTILRTNNPIDFRLVDGVFIDERRPPGAIRGIGNDVVCVVGEFERGPTDVITTISSTREFARVFGGYGPDAAGNPYKGYLSVLNKQFGRLRVIRISNATQVTATLTLDDGAGTPVNVLRVDASSKGRWGNRVSVAIEPAFDGVASHFNLRVLFDGTPQELHRNLDLAAVADDEPLPIASDFIVATRLALGAGRPDDVTATPLATGSDGTFADADYTGSPTDARGLRLLYTSEATNIRWVFLAENTAPNVLAALRDLVESTKTKIAVIAGAPGNTKAQAIADVVAYRSDRIVYVYPWVQTFVPEANNGRGGLVSVSPASFAAAACAALAPGIDPAGVNSEPFLSGIRAINDTTLGYSDYIDFNEQGIMALQFTAERQRYGFRSGRTTSLDPALHMIFRRTMADFLQESIAAALVWYQNRPLKQETKDEIKAAIADFLESQQFNGLLPTKDDLRNFGDGSVLEPYAIDTVSGNTPQDEAQGVFTVILKVRIYPSMRHIVLRTLIGESVEIREDEAA